MGNLLGQTQPDYNRSALGLSDSSRIGWKIKATTKPLAMRSSYRFTNRSYTQIIPGEIAPHKITGEVFHNNERWWEMEHKGSNPNMPWVTYKKYIKDDPSIEFISPDGQSVIEQEKQTLRDKRSGYTKEDLIAIDRFFGGVSITDGNSNTNRGGQYLLNWIEENPEKVRRLYRDKYQKNPKILKVSPVNTHTYSTDEERKEAELKVKQEQKEKMRLLELKLTDFTEDNIRVIGKKHGSITINDEGKVTSHSGTYMVNKWVSNNPHLVPKLVRKKQNTSSFYVIREDANQRAREAADRLAEEKKKLEEKLNSNKDEKRNSNKDETKEKEENPSVNAAEPMKAGFDSEIIKNIPGKYWAAGGAVLLLSLLISGGRQ